MPSPAVYFLFFISGISGLVYQVVWVRQFGFVFGSTVQSAALVTAVFMCGLGLGSYYVGRWSDRAHKTDTRRALKFYGLFEIGIAALGLAILLVLPGLEALAAHFTTYTTGANGWREVALSSHLLRLVTAVLLLAPVTFLMGGTLSLLVRYFVVLDISRAGMRVGALYGINTAGAALGAFISDFTLIPVLGIHGAQAVAVALNLVAGAGALLCLRRASPPPAPAAQDHGADSAAAGAHAPAAIHGADRPLVWGTAATLFVSGFVAMGLEIFWFRYLISGLGALRSVFSLMLTVILTGIFLGAIAGGWLVRRTGKPVALYIAGQTLMVIATLLPLYVLGAHVLALVDPQYLLAIAGGSELKTRVAEVAIYLQSILFIIGIPAFAMGFTFPLANAHVQRVQSAVGGRAGGLYLANTLGNVAGSLATGFVLLPLLGQQQSVGLLAACGIAGLIPLYLTARAPGLRRESAPGYLAGSCAMLAAGMLWSWFQLPANHLIFNLDLQDSRVISVSEGINENIVVTESPEGLRLFTNGHSMSTTYFGAQRYMRLFSHMPLLNMEDPKSVLVVCFGVGSTLNAASLYPTVNTLEVADLSKNVLSQNMYFAASNKGVLGDPRLTVFVNDGRQHLRMQPEDKYDLITLEPPPISFAGVASLYSREFYEIARSRLSQRGFMTQWLPAYQVPADTTLAIIRSFIDVFPNAVLLSGDDNELILMGGKGTAPVFHPDLVRQNLLRYPAVQEDLENIAADSLAALAATFVAGPQVLHEATEGIAPVTDDNPSMEYSTYSVYLTSRLPESIFDAREFDRWCPGCSGGARLPAFRELPYLMEALEDYYHSDLFLNFASNRPELSEKPPRYWQNPCLLDIAQANRYFRQIFQCGPHSK